MSSYAVNKKKFKQHPDVNPETGHHIKIGGKKYKELVEVYGKPGKRSPVRRSPVRRSPAVVRRSPVVRRRSPGIVEGVIDVGVTGVVDSFEVLSEEAIYRVLTKLSPSHRKTWIQSSKKVRSVANKYKMV